MSKLENGLNKREGSFAYIATRKNANRILDSLNGLGYHLDGDVYILDEVFGG